MSSAAARPAQMGAAAALNLAVAATVFAVVFPAELPDKTALASLILGSRYRPVFVFAGVAAAFAVHAVLAVTAGGLLSLLPHRTVEITVAVLFAAGAVLLLRGRRGPGEEQVDLHSASPGAWRVVGTSFAVIIVAEFGDLTQIVIATLAARYHDPVSVGTGAMLGLWAVAALAIAAGRGLLKVIPITWITRAAAAVMLALAIITLTTALHTPTSLRPHAHPRPSTPAPTGAHGCDNQPPITGWLSQRCGRHFGRCLTPSDSRATTSAIRAARRSGRRVVPSIHRR